MSKVTNLVTHSSRKKPLDKLEAQRLINQAAKEASNIKYGKHVRERLRERDFTIRDIEEVLQKGIIKDEPELSEHGDWAYLMRYYGLPDTNREVGCPTIIIKGGKLFVKTIMYVDPRRR